MSGSSDDKATIKAAVISARVAALAAVVAAVSIVVNAVLSLWIDERSRALQILLFAAKQEIPAAAYCDVKLWRDAGMVPFNWATPVMEQQLKQHPGSDKICP